MIQIVKSSPRQTPVIPIKEVKENERYVYVAKTDKDYYLLTKETIGWIFRFWEKHNLGHSGHHGTISKAISHALDLQGTSVFQFDSLKEALEFCQDGE